MNNPINLQISPGEFVDKLTILEIKLERIKDAQQIKNISFEYKTLLKARPTSHQEAPEFVNLSAKLKSINNKLWDIEDQIRACEQKKIFDETFIELARAVYITNDQRSQVKREINNFFGSNLVEEKSYTSY